MTEKFPPLNPPEKKPEEKMTLAELDAHIDRLNAEMADVLRRKESATDPAALKSLDLTFAQKMNERASYEMQRQKLLSSGEKGK